MNPASQLSFPPESQGLVFPQSSDGEAQFLSSIWAIVCQSLGISSSTPTSFHPQSNGMDERFHCSLKTALCACLAGSDRLLHLPLVLLGLHSVPKEDTGFSISQSVFGSPLSVPGEFLESSELPPSPFLHEIEQAVSGFAASLPHHVPPLCLITFLLLCCLQSSSLFVRRHLLSPWPCCTMAHTWSSNSGTNSFASNWVKNQMLCLYVEETSFLRWPHFSSSSAS